MGVVGDSGLCRKNFLLFLLFSLLFLFFVSPLLLHPVLGVSIGVNKGSISYEDVLQNGYAEENVLVTTDSPEEITGTYELEGELAPWIRIEPATNFTFKNGQPHSLKIIVEPPSDAQLRNYGGAVRILTGEIARSTGGKIGQTTRAAFLIKIATSVTGTEHLACQLGGVKIRDTEVRNPFDLIGSIHNTGNVRVKPVFTLSIQDQYQTKNIVNYTLDPNEEILPTTTKEILQHVANSLPEGQYWAQVTAPPCKGGAFLTFDVLPRGGIADKGVFLRIDTTPWAKTGDIIPIKAIFRNAGPRTVSAKFKGTITTVKGGKLVKVIDTDEYNVLPGDTAEIETFFNPTTPGQYIVAGRILYNSKLTFQKSTIINVQGNKMVPSGGNTIIIIIIIVIIILLLILIIKKKRRRKSRRW